MHSPTTTFIHLTQPYVPKARWHPIHTTEFPRHDGREEEKSCACENLYAMQCKKFLQNVWLSNIYIQKYFSILDVYMMY